MFIAKMMLSDRGRLKKKNENFLSIQSKILDYNYLVRKDMDVNELERLSNFTLKHK